MLLFVYSILRLPLVLDILVLHPYDASPNYVLSSAQHNFVHLVVNEFEIVFCTPYWGASGIAYPSLLFAPSWLFCWWFILPLCCWFAMVSAVVCIPFLPELFWCIPPLLPLYIMLPIPPLLLMTSHALLYVQCLVHTAPLLCSISLLLDMKKCSPASLAL